MLILRGGSCATSQDELVACLHAAVRLLPVEWRLPSVLYPCFQAKGALALRDESAFLSRGPHERRGRIVKEVGW